MEKDQKGNDRKEVKNEYNSQLCLPDCSFWFLKAKGAENVIFRESHQVAHSDYNSELGTQV